MISIGKITSVEQAVRYLREAVADHQLEYYTARGEFPGRWSGRGADALGLHGEVSDADFTAVLSGKHPGTGENLGRHWANQTSGRLRRCGVSTQGREHPLRAR